MLLNELFEMNIVDIPPSMRKKLDLRDIKRPQAYDYEVIQPDGTVTQFMTKSAAQDRAQVTGGKVRSLRSTLSQTQP